MAVVIEKYPMVSLITYIIGLFDPYGTHHGEQVAEISEKIGKAIGMGEVELEELVLSALLHDIGKLGVPESIRAKPGRLTEAEYFMMQQHPAIGLKIIRRMNGSLSHNIHHAIYHHHENWNGKGYPEGLSGEEIPLLARILRIADTYDALTHSRGYRLPMSKREALILMVREQQELKLFDPNLFRVFMGIMLGK